MEQGRCRHPDLHGIREGTKPRNEETPSKWKRMLRGTVCYNRYSKDRLDVESEQNGIIIRVR